MAEDDSEEAYPPMYTSADKTSMAKQKAYFLTVKIELLLLVAVAIASALPWSDWQDATGRKSGAAIALTLLLGAIGSRIIRGVYKFEESWFKARALAESVKVEAWRYMMRAEPYQGKHAESRYVERLRQLVASDEAVFGALAEKPTPGLSQITSYMTGMRGRTVKERHSTYTSKRLTNQQEWYQHRGQDHSKSDKKWSAWGYAFEALAVVFAIVAILFAIDLGLMGVLTTLAAAFAAWFQSKDFRRLAATYGVVAQDLTLIATQDPKQASEESLNRLVDEVERTLSREHTFWLDRRLKH
ncbi:MAG TPA: DUF4231 domain-containing protein [Candidatus Thermoplasmatota archaeon]|nr:DUF4231 domain-containing protein [Candidatus Thermoplasmatota archaeon]